MQKIVHAGYTRHIIYTNPRRYDSEGHELASSDEDSRADADLADRDPYSEVDILGIHFASRFVILTKALPSTIDATDAAARPRASSGVIFTLQIESLKRNGRDCRSHVASRAKEVD